MRRGHLESCSSLRDDVRRPCDCIAGQEPWGLLLATPLWPRGERPPVKLPTGTLGR